MRKMGSDKGIPTMPFQDTIQRVRDELQTTFTQLDACCALPAAVRRFRLAADAWTIDDILEHTSLTNHFLMITLHQSLIKVLRRAHEQPIPEGESQLDAIMQISDPDAFGWIRPAHMEPTRTVTVEETRARLRQQYDECRDMLSQISRGEGALHEVRMSVRGLGKLDMYAWMYFLIQHAQRHLNEMRYLRAQYDQRSSRTE